MHCGVASALPIASARVLLLPLGIFGFFLFLLLLGALALGLSMSLISALLWLMRLPGRKNDARRA